MYERHTIRRRFQITHLCRFDAARAQFDTRAYTPHFEQDRTTLHSVCTYVRTYTNVYIFFMSLLCTSISIHIFNLCCIDTLALNFADRTFNYILAKFYFSWSFSLFFVCA